MSSVSKTLVRHKVESGMLMRALDGDIGAAEKCLNYLSSSNPHLCQIMQEAIHDLDDSRLWQSLLQCLALHQWQDNIDCNRRSDPLASERIDQSIIEVFILDERDWEKTTKETLLLQSLEDPEQFVRYAAAFILGMRGDLRAVPVLAETMESGIERWQKRALKTLTSLNDELCGPPLLRLLILGKGELHREAGRALRKLSVHAKSTWLEGLKHPDSHIRWHSARGLGEIGEVQYADMLAEGLRDENYVVRWASADVLANLGAAAVPSTLKMLIHHKLDEPFRQAAYHSLNGIKSRKIQARLKPLLEALHGRTAGVEVPMFAQHLLEEWEN